MKELDTENLSRGHWINVDTTVRKKKSYKKGSDLTNSSLSLLKSEVRKNNPVECFSKKFKTHDQNS